LWNWRGELSSCYGGGEKAKHVTKKKPTRPKFLTPAEEKFWRLRFEAERFLIIREIEDELRVDRSCFRTGVRKLLWNAERGFMTDQARELLDLAVKSVEVVKAKDNPHLIEELVARRAHQINWERRYRRLKD
jgi:hypothetical protein